MVINGKASHSLAGKVWGHPLRARFDEDCLQSASGYRISRYITTNSREGKKKQIPPSVDADVLV